MSADIEIQKIGKSGGNSTHGAQIKFMGIHTIWVSLS